MAKKKAGRYYSKPANEPQRRADNRLRFDNDMFDGGVKYDANPTERDMERSYDNRVPYRSMPVHEPSERAMERRAGGMISEDHRAIANMPQQVVYREYPKTEKYLNSNLDDTMRGIEKQMNEDVEQANDHKARWMY